MVLDIGGYFKTGVLVMNFLSQLLLTLVIGVINYFYLRKRSISTPSVDERTVANMIKFYAYSSQVFF